MLLLCCSCVVVSKLQQVLFTQSIIFLQLRVGMKAQVHGCVCCMREIAIEVAREQDSVQSAICTAQSLNLALVHSEWSLAGCEKSLQILGGRRQPKGVYVAHLPRCGHQRDKVACAATQAISHSRVARGAQVHDCDECSPCSQADRQAVNSVAAYKMTLATHLRAQAIHQSVADALRRYDVGADAVLQQSLRRPHPPHHPAAGPLFARLHIQHGHLVLHLIVHDDFVVHKLVYDVNGLGQLHVKREVQIDVAVVGAVVVA